MPFSRRPFPPPSIAADPTQRRRGAFAGALFAAVVLCAAVPASAPAASIRVEVQGELLMGQAVQLVATGVADGEESSGVDITVFPGHTRACPQGHRDEGPPYYDDEHDQPLIGSGGPGAFSASAEWTPKAAGKYRICGQVHSLESYAIGYASSTLDVEVRAGECADGSSNDFDGLADYPLDPGCTSATDPSELGEVECDNGVDDDRDGTTDWPLDRTCTSAAEDDEDLVIALDDGTTVVDYAANGSAPPRSLNVLTNDLGPDLWIDNVSARPGEAIAPNFGAGDRGIVRYAPPTGFVGPVDVTYGIRTGSDPVGTTRDSAEWKLLYRQCRTHAIDLIGVNYAGLKQLARASGRYKVCTDGNTAAGKVVSLETKYNQHSHRLFSRAIGAVATAITRGAVTYQSTARWAKSPKGSSVLSAGLVVCDRWTFTAKLKLSKRQRDALEKRLSRVVGKRLAKSLVGRLQARDDSSQCSNWVRYEAGPVESYGEGYEIRVRDDTEDPRKSAILHRKIATDIGTTRHTSPPRALVVSCRYIRDVVDGSFGMERCKLASAAR